MIVLLQIIKDLAFDANEKKHPPRQVAQALKHLVLARQEEDEELVNYYKQFVSISEMVETTYGKIEPVEVAKKDSKYSTNKSKIIKQEQNKLLAFLFMDGANRQQYGFLLQDLGKDHALGSDQYTEMVEDTLQVLSLYVKKHKNNKESEEKSIDRLCADWKTEEQNEVLELWQAGSWCERLP